MCPPVCVGVCVNVLIFGQFHKFVAGKPPLACMDDDVAIITPSRSCQDSSAVVQGIEAVKDGEIDG